MTDNLFKQLPRSTEKNEQFSELLKQPGLRIERIVSTGQASQRTSGTTSPAVNGCC
jgi:cupin 2 domain-containing protein